MKLTVSGLVGSGKSTVSKLLAEKLGYEYHSVGKIMRQMAASRGISLIELSKFAEADNSIDVELDDLQLEIGKTRERFVLDSRLGFHFVPDSFKIFLYCDLDEATRRIDKDKRPGEAYESFEEGKKQLERRILSEKIRYKEYYGIDFPEGCFFDLKIDTTNLSPEKVVEKILESLPKENC